MDILGLQNKIILSVENDSDLIGLGLEAKRKVIFRTTRNLRLRKSGNEILLKYYDSYTIKIDKHILTTRQRITLQFASKLPYYISSMQYVTYDHMLGIKLKLAEGNLSRVLDTLF